MTKALVSGLWGTRKIHTTESHMPGTVLRTRDSDTGTSMPLLCSLPACTNTWHTLANICINKFLSLKIFYSFLDITTDYVLKDSILQGYWFLYSVFTIHLEEASHKLLSPQWNYGKRRERFTLTEGGRRHWVSWFHRLQSLVQWIFLLSAVTAQYIMVGAHSSLHDIWKTNREKDKEGVGIPISPLRHTPWWPNFPHLIPTSSSSMTSQ